MKDYLPLGTVVTLKGGTQRIMIVGRIQKQPDTSRIYDYAAVLWPVGLIDSDHFYLFNHEDIEILYHIGHQDTEEFQYRTVLDEETKKLNL
ncbi:MAG: DUF4176 domain-containing protein [Erysipelotrichaceae bacterium]|jgi:hypothetical protein|nr:DUF4176 domain-containing protein [Erysipelotrichaceae bacterium]